MINMDTEKDYGEAHLNPLQRQNMRIFIEATKSLMDSVGEEGLSIRRALKFSLSYIPSRSHQAGEGF